MVSFLRRGRRRGGEGGGKGGGVKCGVVEVVGERGRVGGVCGYFLETPVFFGGGWVVRRRKKRKGGEGRERGGKYVF